MANAVGIQQFMPARAAPWAVNYSADDVSGCESIKAAPAASTALYITKIVLMADADIDVTIGDGEDTSAVETTLLGPIPCVTEGTVITFDLGPGGAKLTDAKAFTIDASAAGTVCVYAEGYTV